jgi:acyl carrier protein
MYNDTAFHRYEGLLKTIIGAAAPSRLGPTDRLADLGWSDSLSIVQLIAQIEEGLQVRMPEETLTVDTFETVDSLWLVLSAIMGSAGELH